MAFSEHALSILKDNYYARDAKGVLLESTPEELMRRIATSIFPDQHEYMLELYEALMAQEVIFNSPVMFNIGLPTKQILAACWVGDLKDDMDSILDAARVTGQVFKYGSGMGLPLTNLRPKNDSVSNAGYASGPLSFMEVYDKLGEVIKSGGKRRAAFMSMNRVDHPDIEDIILAKKGSVGDLGNQYLENMNISIAVTDEFMQAVKSGGSFDLQFAGRVHKTIDATKLFDLMAECAWLSGDPGIFYIDTTNKKNPLPGFAAIQSTNPCVAGDTIVQTVNGPARIDELVGQTPHIYCKDEHDNLAVAQAAWVKQTRKSAGTLIIHLNTGNSITVTPDHKIYVEGYGYVEAQNLNSADRLFFLDGDNLTPTGSVVKVELGPTIDVYDMSVPGYNNFIANDIVVHNCGEQALHPWTCCNLGHINLNALVKFSNLQWVFDYEKFVMLTKLMTFALDRLIDIMDFPSDQFRKNTLKTRPIGLGFTGLAEVLYKLRIPYSNSQKFVAEITHLMNSTAIETSIELAAEFGTSKTIMNNIEVLANLVLQYTGDSDLYHACLEHGIRNSSWTTLAPTGTTSLATDAKSYGIEPQFSLAYQKNFISQGTDTVERKHTYFNEEFGRVIKELKLDPEKVFADMSKHKGSCQKLTYIPEHIRRVFEVAHDLTPKQHLLICAAAQPYISSAISKTINLDSEATVDEIKEVYMTAWELGLKGATVYRDNCKEFQPINFSGGKTIADFAKLPRGTSIIRGDEAIGGSIDAWRTACTKMYVATGYSKEYPDVLIETFLNKRSGGGCDSNLKAIALLISLALRKGIQVKDIEDELFSITCSHCVSAKASGKDINAMSCPQACARTLRKQSEVAANYAYLDKKSTPRPAKQVVLAAPTGNTCDKCGELTIIASGCRTCIGCGVGECS